MSNEYSLEYLREKHKDVIENPAIKKVLKYKIYDPNQEETNFKECIENATKNAKSHLDALLRKIPNSQENNF